eukprot:Nk52_evm75s207 gene=Nk52_evmTU75s207
MFIYLSKKIAIPNGVRIHSLGWNKDQGWIACGGSDGLLKVLKLESQVTKDAKLRGFAAPSNLTMNQTLEGHNGAVKVVSWNDHYRKLTTSDDNGLIIVWMLYKGMWYEEMINNRNKSVVSDMKWSSDGTKICIIYEDGAVIVGSVDGNRIWGKELRNMELAFVHWSPDGLFILFCTTDGQVHIYDNTGNPLSTVPITCLQNVVGVPRFAGIEWYNGSHGYVESDCPCLAIAYKNGRIQLMRNQRDDKPIVVDSKITISKIAWNNNGSILAVSGNQSVSVNGETKEVGVVCFFTPLGEQLRTLKVPGNDVSCCTWENGGLRIALSVDSFVYFANIRPNYQWAQMNKTIVYAFTKAGRAEHCITFWDTANNQKYVKYVANLLQMCAFKDHCLLLTKPSDTSQKYALVLCNELGAPQETKHIDLKPSLIHINERFAFAASASVIYAWNFGTSKKSNGSERIPSARGPKSREKLFHIDDVPSSSGIGENIEEFKKLNVHTNDDITAITASEDALMVARASGSLHKYTLPHISLDSKFSLRCRAQHICFNCDSTRLAIIDISGVFSIFDMTIKNDGAATASPADVGGRPVSAAMGNRQSSVATFRSTSTMGKHLPFERRDVWDMKWAEDNPNLFCVMEKARMYIFRGLDPEEPVLNSGYICSFNDLEIKAVLLDEIMKDPEHPAKDHLFQLETKSLRDTKQLLANVGIQDAYQFIEDNSHRRLWDLLAEGALENLNFDIADKAFVKSEDYQGLEFVKRLRKIDNKQLQKAEVYAHFGHFEEAEKMYLNIDRRDLAINLRLKLGDWFRVVHLVNSGGGGDDSLLVQAWNGIGNYYADRQKWTSAVSYFSQARNQEKMIHCYFMLEDFEGLEKVAQSLPDNHKLLEKIADIFVSVGLSAQALTTYSRCGKIKKAVDACVELNQWSQAVELARMNDMKEIDALLAKYAAHLLEKQKKLQAIELYRKANHFVEAAKLLCSLAKESEKMKPNPLRAKKLHVLAALQVEKYHEFHIATSKLHAGKASAAANALDGLLEEDASAQADTKFVDNAWRGAEAYHFFLLAQRQLYEGSPEAALKTAVRLSDYESSMNPVEIYSLVALTGYINKAFAVCSQAFIKLEKLPLSQEEMEKYQDMALTIFTKNPPTNLYIDSIECNGCAATIPGW